MVISASAAAHLLYQSGSLVFAVAAAFYLGFCVRRVRGRIGGVRWTPRFFTLVALAIALGAGWYAAALLARHGNRIDSVLARVLSRTYTPPVVGFGRQARLGSVMKMKYGIMEKHESILGPTIAAFMYLFPNLRYRGNHKWVYYRCQDRLPIHV